MGNDLVTPRERPVLFSAPMVRALLSGTKTQTRRVVKPQPGDEDGDLLCGLYHPTIIVRGDEEPGPATFGAYTSDGRWAAPCPYGQPGDRLWVRESWSRDCDPHWVMYRADGSAQRRSGGELFDACAAEELNPLARWKPSIHMRREDSRITLEVTEVRVERLQAISEADAIAEGIEQSPPEHREAGPLQFHVRDANGSANFRTAVEAYEYLWESINGPSSWEANPWVWVVAFRRVDQPAA